MSLERPWLPTGASAQRPNVEFREGEDGERWGANIRSPSVRLAF